MEGNTKEQDTEMVETHLKDECMAVTGGLCQTGRSCSNRGQEVKAWARAGQALWYSQFRT